MRRSVPSVAREFASVQLGDGRLHRRVGQVVERLCKAPDLGFPRALKTEKETEGFYRLVANRRVRYGSLVEPHARETLGRMASGATVRVIHDTTELAFGGDPASREGLGRLRSKKDEQGFFAHVAFAVDGTAYAKPLGTIGAICWARTAPRRAKRKLSGEELTKLAGKESDRWSELVEQVENLIAGKSSAIHLMDREGDSFPLFCSLKSRGARFVIRMARDRKVESEDERMPLSEAVLALPKYLEREVPLSRRAAKPTPRSQGQRAARVAKLSVSAGGIALQKPRYCDDDLPEQLDVNIVYVQEVDAPKHEEPIAWVLVTTEKVETPEQVAAVVDHYRARWLIEEFFKALKTGCALERRQLESFSALTNALALFLPIAWQMLLLRAVSRLDPNAPASEVLTPTQIAVLRHYQPQKMPAQRATAKDALYAVAGLGGHLKNNGPPGWRTLAYGMQELTSLASAWDAAISFAGKSS